MRNHRQPRPPGERHKFGDRLLAARQDNFLTRFDARQKLRQDRLCGANRHDFHATPLAKPI
jgi:hypothetical protein